MRFKKKYVIVLKRMSICRILVVMDWSMSLEQHVGWICANSSLQCATTIVRVFLKLMHCIICDHCKLSLSLPDTYVCVHHYETQPWVWDSRKKNHYINQCQVAWSSMLTVLIHGYNNNSKFTQFSVVVNLCDVTTIGLNTLQTIFFLSHRVALFL